MGKIAEYFTAMLRAFRFWRPATPIRTADELAEFCFQQASFVAQTSLYGYLRTRAGLQHFNLFTDQKFTALLKPARSRLVIICLDDLAVYAAALLPTTDKVVRQALAVQLFTDGAEQLQAGSSGDLEAAEFQAAGEEFAARAALIDWSARAAPDKGIVAFSKSAKALITLAPIVDDLKKYDDEIVTNSMHFKWHGVRAQLRERMHAEALLASLT